MSETTPKPRPTANIGRNTRQALYRAKARQVLGLAPLRTPTLWPVVKVVAGPVVYFIQAEEGGPIKIGYTNNLARRLYALRTGHPSRLRVLATIAGDRATEQTTHSAFSEERINGSEWFRPSSRLLSYINSR